MKQALGIGFVLTLLAGGAYLSTQHGTEVYVREDIDPVEEVIEAPEYPAEWLEEAEAAKKAVIQRRKLEAERDELIESRTEIQERINEVEKKLGVY